MNIYIQSIGNLISIQYDSSGEVVQGLELKKGGLLQKIATYGSIVSAEGVHVELLGKNIHLIEPFLNKCCFMIIEPIHGKYLIGYHEMGAPLSVSGSGSIITFNGTPHRFEDIFFNTKEDTISMIENIMKE